MYPWDDDRRRFAAIDEQNRVNEEIAERDRRNIRPGSGFGYLVFMLVVIFFKPIAEYFIDLYTSIASFTRSLGTLIGF